MFWQLKHQSGYSVLEVIIAISIFGIVTSSIFQLIAHTDRLRGRALFVENATQLASDEAERVRSIAAQNIPIEDSSYTIMVAEREFSIDRRVLETDEELSFLPNKREPAEIEIQVSDTRNVSVRPVRFKLLSGVDSP